MSSVSAIKEETQAPAPLTETIVDKLNNPSASSDFDFHAGVNQVLADVGMSAADSGGQLTFYGQDPVVPSPIRFGTTAGLSLAAKTVAAAAIWRLDEQVYLSKSPGSYRTVLVPRGSNKPEWRS
jgi:hypothetical protein